MDSFQALSIDDLAIPVYDYLLWLIYPFSINKFKKPLIKSVSDAILLA